jgi:plastocyanin
MRKLTVLVCALAALAILPTSVGAATKTVRVGDNFFSPRSITISKGSSVRWRWVGDARHNVVATRGASFRSTIKASGTYTRTFRRRGTVRYICTIHPSSMRGTITVR